MNKKLIAGIIIIVLALAAGAGYWYMTKKNAPQPQEPQVQGQEVSAGTGEQATPGSVVSVLYVGKLPDGTTFDSSEANGNVPLTFRLGAQGVIVGFQIGVNGMKVGGERIVSIPPELGYGAEEKKDANGKVIIPANSTLIFDIKLVKVQTLAEAQAAATATSTSKKVQ